MYQKEISRSHNLWTGVPEVFHDVETALKLIERLEDYTVCCGNPESEYQDLVPVGSGLTNSSSINIVAYRYSEIDRYLYYLHIWESDNIMNKHAILVQN